MIQLEDFEAYLATIPKNDWDGLFALLPQIRNTNTFGIIEQVSPLFLTVKRCAIVDSLMSYLKSLELFPVFEWIIWKRGQRIINDASFDFKSLEIKELCMLLTVVFRLDEFNEGYLVGKFEDGIMLAILEALEMKISKML